MKIVIALDGNAILKLQQVGTMEEQMHNIELSCKNIVETIEKGYRVLISHGNGPQVGNILIQNQVSPKLIPSIPLSICGAKSQGMIGYMLQ